MANFERLAHHLTRLSAPGSKIDASNLSAEEAAYVEVHFGLRAGGYHYAPLSADASIASMYLAGTGYREDEPVYTPDEILKLIRPLTRLNQLGHNVEITPMDPEHHFMLIERMTAEALANFETKYDPALVIERRPGLFQAVLKVPAHSGLADEPEAVIAVQRNLNERFGDPLMSAELNQPILLPGMADHSAGRDKTTWLSRVVSKAGGVCRRAAEQVDHMWQRITKARADEQIEAREALNSPAAMTDTEPFPVFRPPTAPPAPTAAPAPGPWQKRKPAPVVQPKKWPHNLDLPRAAEGSIDEAHDIARQTAQGRAVFEQDYTPAPSRILTDTAQHMVADRWLPEAVADVMMVRSKDLLDTFSNPRATITGILDRLTGRNRKAKPAPKPGPWGTPSM